MGKTLENSHKFFCNRDCDYFPCHETETPERFNCLFCFCPLYFLEDCGGDPVYTGGIKDCSKCCRPHLPEKYEEIIERVKTELDKKRCEK